MYDSSLEFTGVTIKIMDTEINTVIDSGFFRPRSMSAEVHEHPYYEVHLCSKGEYSLETEKKCRLKISTGEMCIIPPSCYHATVSSYNDTVKYAIKFMFKDSKRSILRDRFEDIRQPTVISGNAELLRIIGKITDEINTKPLAYDDMLESLIREFYITLARMVCEKLKISLTPKAAQSAEISDEESARNQKLEKYFRENYMNDVTAEDLGHAIGLSVRQVNRILNKTYRMGFREKLIDARLHAAESEMLSTDKTIEQIGFDVGYFSSSGFSIAFRKKYGMSPAEYKRKYKV